MLSSIRKFSTSIYAKILLGIIIIPFVFWGMGSVFSGGNTNIPQNTTGPEGAEWSYEDGFTGGGQEGSPQVSGYGMDEGGFS